MASRSILCNKSNKDIERLRDSSLHEMPNSIFVAAQPDQAVVFYCLYLALCSLSLSAPDFTFNAMLHSEGAKYL